MNVKCPCGGRYRRTDIIEVPGSIQKYGHQMYTDADPKVAHWQCDRCGRKREQRKRQPKEKTA